MRGSGRGCERQRDLTVNRVLRKHHTYRTPTGHTWRITDVRRKNVEAESVEAPGLTATISRSSMSGWTRVDDARIERRAA